MTNPILRTHALGVTAIGALTLLCAGCAAIDRANVQDTEQLLSAAGFDRRPADTPQTQAQLAALPPEKLLARPGHTAGNDGAQYVYADPKQCHCVFVGDANAYNAYQRLAVQKKIADERMLAAEEYDDAATFDWGPWPSPYWR
jgi:hypothetical protein